MTLQMNFYVYQERLTMFVSTCIEGYWSIVTFSRYQINLKVNLISISILLKLNLWITEMNIMKISFKKWKGRSVRYLGFWCDASVGINNNRKNKSSWILSSFMPYILSISILYFHCHSFFWHFTDDSCLETRWESVSLAMTFSI